MSGARAVFLAVIVMGGVAVAYWFYRPVMTPVAAPGLGEIEGPSSGNRAPPIDLSALAERLNSPPSLTEEQIDEDSKLTAEQVHLAEQWLHSASPEERLQGAEQLSAYPTPEAEELLVEAIETDPDPSVRMAAADSLQQFKRPAERTIAVLIAALGDESGDVQMSALATLQAIAAAEPARSARSRTIVAGLKQQRSDRRVKKAVRRVIADYLADQGISTP